MLSQTEPKKNANVSARSIVSYKLTLAHKLGKVLGTTLLGARYTAARRIYSLDLPSKL